MQCDKCRNEAVLFQPSSGQHLCGRHLAADIEARAKRAIRSHHWMKSGDHIAVIRTGDRKSTALLIFLKRLIANRQDIRLSTLVACTDQTGGCRPSVVPEDTGIADISPGGILQPGGHRIPAHDRPTKIALAVTVDDIASEVLAQFLFGNAENLIHPPRAAAGGIEIISPFIAIPSEELDCYLDVQEVETGPVSCPPLHKPLPLQEDLLFRNYCHRHPATRFALLNIAEELSSRNAAGIAADIGKGRKGSEEMTVEVPGNGT